MTAHDNDGNTGEAGADEVVTFDLIPPTVDLTKQDQPDGNATVDEPGGDVPYKITMTNTSDEPVRDHQTDRDDPVRRPRRGDRVQLAQPSDAGLRRQLLGGRH